MDPDRRYTRVSKLGEGTYGVVTKAVDTTKPEDDINRIVAIKKIRMQHYKEGVSVPALREIKLLRELHHPNVIGLLDVYAHKGSVHMVLEYCITDLEEVIRDRSIFLTREETKCCLHQILSGTAACHKAWALHRDLKPANILVGADGRLKLADFGLARVHASPQQRLSPTVITRWYRPPELLYAAKKYGPAVDMWSIGCIFAELMLRMPYLPGDSDTDQLAKIFQARGTPEPDDWPERKLLPCYVEFSSSPAPDHRIVFTGATAAALDLLDKLLQFDPSRRISAEEALQHDYFTTEAPKQCTPEALSKKIRSGNTVKDDEV